MKLKVAMNLRGALELSDPETRRTVGGFAQFVTANDLTLQRYFGHKLFPGSLNVRVTEPSSLQQDLDARLATPLFVIPREELEDMPVYIGDGQAWACNLYSEKFPSSIGCWIFRRIRSRVPPGVIEIVAVERWSGHTSCNTQIRSLSRSSPTAQECDVDNSLATHHPRA